MLNEAISFWDAISGKVKQLISRETKNAFRCERYEVTTAPNGSTIGVTLPLGTTEIQIPYSKEVAGAAVGNTVLVVWWGSMSNAKAYYYANGYEGAIGGGSEAIATITFPAAWVDSGNGYWTVVPVIDDAAIDAESKVDLQPSEAVIAQLQSDGVQTLKVVNDAAALTAYATGAAPSGAVTMQCTVSGTSAGSAPVNPALDAVYPVGSVYISVTSVNPANVFGGTWERIKDMFLLAAGDTYAPGATGGEAEHTLTVDEMPGHKHELAGEYGAVGVTARNPWNTYTQLAGANAGTHDWNDMAVSSAGGGLAHNNMPPYLAVYMWQRTA